MERKLSRKPARTKRFASRDPWTCGLWDRDPRRTCPSLERDFTRLKREEIRKRFDQIYEKLYGRTYPDSAVEFINFKVRASLPERLFKFSKLEKKGQSLKAAVKGRRPAYSGIAKDFIPYTVYDRYKLFPNAKFKGPAIIEEKESTLIVGEDTTVAVDEYGFLWVDLKTAQGSTQTRHRGRLKAKDYKAAKHQDLGSRSQAQSQTCQNKGSGSEAQVAGCEAKGEDVQNPRLKSKVQSAKLKAQQGKVKQS